MVAMFTLEKILRARTREAHKWLTNVMQFHDEHCVIGSAMLDNIG